MIKKEKVTDKKAALLDATLTLVNNHGFHNTPMSKIAKLAGVSPATIYLYFEHKQDLINSLYLKVKKSLSESAFKGYDSQMSVKQGFEIIWFNIADYKLKQISEATFLSQCDNSPMIGEAIRIEGLKNLQPLLDHWERGKNEGIIKPVSDYVLYAHTIYPLSFLLEMQARDIFTLDENTKSEMFQVAWDAVKM
ncbi:TetR/AcrR family transcriptional regulator [Kaistella palustris]|uniref:TetR/AcrR family transcriptional regulator n=1 Tax=Kaistella palustris TaxID=493376 RepID=UPI000426A574|nr:TetR/AcrR family transcriptional regulator [Kaistella palustris]